VKRWRGEMEEDKGCNVIPRSVAAVAMHGYTALVRVSEYMRGVRTCVTSRFQFAITFYNDGDENNVASRT
jgi:hypothetical protein